ncbi:hypothetical protein B0O80DRAFT_493106 [Mortierella sp. GBAus27b]|nr:hypothetical protein B0O80DRAFT_493106 [Mortierella sp. GBAus27b]
MPSGNPLEIPEILQIIASHLPHKDLARCLRVSKDWRDLFLPLVWHAIEMDLRKRPNAGFQPRTIIRRRYLIRVLRIVGDEVSLNNINFPFLQLVSFLSFPLAFPSLVSLTISGVDLRPAVWTTLSLHHLIQNIHVSLSAIADAAGFWRACMNLTSVHISFCNMVNAAIPPDVLFPRMRNLHLEYIGGMNEAALLGLFFRSPNLRTMTWITSTHRLPRLIHRPIQSGYWAHLGSLRIHSKLQDTDLVSILNSVGTSGGGMRDFLLLGPALRTEPFRQLGAHFGSLVSLNLEESLSTTSRMLQEILCGCPGLEVLYARSVLASDIEMGEPWRCQRLRELKICFRFGGSGRHLHPLVFERLSTLVRLERLTVYIPSYEVNDEHGALKFRLDHGLDKLKSVQRLAILEFGRVNKIHYPEMDMDDVVWVMDNLKNLRTISGDLNENREENRRLGDALRERGVLVT